MTKGLDDALSAAAKLWPLASEAPELLSHRENAVYCVALETGEKAALRLHRPGYNSADEILSELVWTQALADKGFAVPRPIPSRSGALFEQVSDTQVATCLSWAEGGPLGAGGDPLGGSATEKIALYQNVGRLLADLHNLSDAFDPPQNFTRRSWDQDGFLGNNPLWGRFWENPALKPDEGKYLLESRDIARDALTKYRNDCADFGLIHADALRENIFRDGDALTLIDFDDAGYGFRMFDLTTALSQSLLDPDHDQLLDALFDGYAAKRPLRQTDRDHARLFTMLRAFASLGWIVPRTKPGDPRQRSNCDRALWAARRFRDG